MELDINMAHLLYGDRLSIGHPYTASLAITLHA